MQLKFLFALALMAAPLSGIADTLQYHTENGAIDGYDPVAYFENGAAERGRPDVTAQWNGATWHFTSANHREMFLNDPDRFAPRYGGFCALGMAHGGAVPTNPKAWTIHDGKLYLNMIDEVTTTWRYTPDRLIERANAKWEAMNR